MSMDPFILDILEAAQENGELEFDGDRDSWARDIELYAPGYLAMEAQDRGAEYEPANLRDPEEAWLARQQALMEEANAQR